MPTGLFHTYWEEVNMARRSEKRDAAKAEYCARRAKGEKIVLKDFAAKLGVSYDLVRKWKRDDQWETAVPRKRGGQPGNKNSKGKKNAKGNTGGAPKGNKNAEKDGAYSTIFFDFLTENEKKLIDCTPKDGVEVLEHELLVLKLREKKILDKIAKYEELDKENQDTLLLTSLMDMRGPDKQKDGAVQNLGMYTKETPFARILKLQEALYKVQGRIATVANALRQAKENQDRLNLENKKLELMRMRALGAVEVEDNDTVHEQEDG